jgi:hypothetical protein
MYASYSHSGVKGLVNKHPAVRDDPPLFLIICTEGLSLTAVTCGKA